jgi:CubicO group peptidase (beta-lactamase class C family)
VLVHRQPLTDVHPEGAGEVAKMLKVEVPTALIRGEVEEGYGKVADAFRRNFSERGEIGAACAFYRDGHKVVDLWGGYRDGIEKLPWERDTLVTVFSSTKGMSSTAIPIAHSRGWIDVDERVATYWPEFAQNGKAAITVRQLMSHQAGLAILDRKLDLATVADPDRLATILAAQTPGWEPGTRQGYHAVTLGFYESELLRRVDPQARTLGRFFAEEIADPLDAEFYIGVPAGVGDERIATIHAFAPPEMLLHINDMPTRLLVSMLNPRGTLSRAMRTMSFLLEPGAFNRREVREAELPSVNGTGQIRAMARIYGCLATGGTELGLGPETLRLLEEPGTAPSGKQRDLVVQMNARFSLGYLKPSPGHEFGSSDRAYGTPGGGGSLGFVDPDAGVGYAYGMNRLGFHNPIDPRELAIRAAFYDVIGERPQTG